MIPAVAALGLASAAAGQGLVEFPIPTANSQPLGIAAGPDGNVWFTETTANKIGRITPAGVITEFTIPTAGSFPSGIAAGPDGNLWFTEEGANKIGRMTPTGFFTDFSIPTDFSGAESITAGPDGNLWFAEANVGIGRITPAGVVTEFPIPSGGFPRDITAGPDGALWFDESGPNGTGLGRITTAGVITEFPIPTANVFLSGIASGSDGAIWFTENIGLGGKIGRITTAGVITEFAIPPIPGLIQPIGVPGGITAGPDGALWFMELSGVGRITTDGVVTQFLVPNANSGPAAIAAGPDGNLWFIEAPFSGGRGIGRIGPAACPLSATILCLDNSRFKAEAAWTTGDGRSGAAQARFLSPVAGYLWFFSPSIPDLMVKIVDGCSFNNRRWLFIAGLTDVHVTLTVTDALTGQARTYTNPQSTRFPAIQDTGAFDCP